MPINSIIVSCNRGVERVVSGEVTSLFSELPACNIVSTNGRYYASLGKDGIAVSEDGGATWWQTGPLGYSIVCVKPNPHDSDMMLAGGQPASVLVSRDRGRNWRVLVDFASIPGTDHWEIPIRDMNKKEVSESAGDGAAAWNVEVDPGDPDRLIVGVEVGGILVSDNFGKSWRIEIVGDSPDPHVISIHPKDPKVSLTSTGYSRFTDKKGVFQYAHNGGVYRSTDTFKSFEEAWPKDPEPQYTRAMCWDDRAPYPATVCVRSSYVQPSNPDGKRLAAIKQTIDLGENWRNLGDSEHEAFDEEFSAILPDPDKVGDVLVATELGKIYRVDAKRRIWSQLADLETPITAMVVG